MRAQLSGWSWEIGDISYYDWFLENPDVDVVSLFLEDGVAFEKASYVASGYTKYQVWCVGGAGGRGGDATNVVKWRIETTEETIPSDIWDEIIDAYNALNGPDYVYNGNSEAGTPEPPEGVLYWDTPEGHTDIVWQLTPIGLAWLRFPEQKATVIHWLEPIVQPGKYIGGGGGGGGLHVVSGLLADLPDSVPVSIGQAGDDGAPGQYQSLAPWNSAPAWSAGGYPQMSHAHWDFLNRFPNGQPTIGAPTDGESGGTSLFGDIAKASGGLGGGAAIGWDGGVSGTALRARGWGGDGGIGDSDTPGGGGSGAVPPNPPYLPSALPAEDGRWNGTIGSGGGGGAGGMKPGPPSLQASDGSRGSMNFRDTTVFGPRGKRGTYSILVTNYTQTTVLVGDFLGAGTVYGVYVGDPISTVTTPIPLDFNPGAGGGARVNPTNQKHHGSRAKGAIPDGAVFIRIFEIVG